MGCEPIGPIYIQNETDQTLTIFLHDIYEGEVAPDAELKVENMPRIYGKYPIEAKNPKGEVVFHKEFTVREMLDKDWKVVIPPLDDKQPPNPNS